MSVDSTVPRIRIGPDYTIPRVIIGAWQLSRGHSSKPIERESLFSAFDRLIDLGMNTFDCADIYTGVEELLGEFLRRRRARYGESGIENVQIHTKFVPNLDTLASTSRRDVERDVDRSRRRLGLEQIAMVQFAWWDYRVPRYVEVALWLSDLINTGRIRLLGATNFDHHRLRELLNAGVPIALHQLQYSIVDQRPRRDMTDLSTEHRLWHVCYGTLAGGFLTERYLGTPEPSEPFENRSLRKYKLIIDEFGGWASLQECLIQLQAVAEQHDTTIANVATRFILDRDWVAAAILGTRSEKHIDDMLRMLQLRLDDRDRHRIESILADARGPRGDVFELERNRDGAHGKIMQYNLNDP